MCICMCVYVCVYMYVFVCAYISNNNKEGAIDLRGKSWVSWKMKSVGWK